MHRTEDLGREEGAERAESADPGLGAFGSHRKNNTPPVTWLPRCLLKRCLCSPLSESLRLRGPEPARLLRPWDYLGKNTGVGHYSLLQGLFLTRALNPSLLSLLRWWEDSLHHLGSPKRCLNEWVKVAQSCPTLCDSPRNSPGQNAGVGSLSLLQGIFPTQGSNPGLPHCINLPSRCIMAAFSCNVLK